jgi:hypothetical protein
MPTYINAILNRDKPEEVAEAEVESVGEIQAEEAAEAAADTNGTAKDPFDVVRSVLRGLGEALIAAAGK